MPGLQGGDEIQFFVIIIILLCFSARITIVPSSKTMAAVVFKCNCNIPNQMTMKIRRNRKVLQIHDSMFLLCETRKVNLNADQIRLEPDSEMSASVPPVIYLIYCFFSTRSDFEGFLKPSVGTGGLSATVVPQNTTNLFLVASITPKASLFQRNVCPILVTTCVNASCM